MAAPMTEGRLVGDKYRLVRKLGEGAAASAWVAENTVVGRVVAIKILHADLAKDDATRQRFLAEARAAARIAHANVVDVFDLGTDHDGTPFIVLELCDGETLSAIIDERGAMGATYASDLMMQVLAALHAAHELGIVHRDLKPDNLFLCERDDGPPRIKLLDFGIAKIVAANAASANATQAVGTPLYMAPEQFLVESAVSSATDLYALAMIAYTMLVGQT
jgi:serine/threonine-protein kinase